MNVIPPIRWATEYPESRALRAGHFFVLEPPSKRIGIITQWIGYRDWNPTPPAVPVVPREMGEIPIP